MKTVVYVITITFSALFGAIEPFASDCLFCRTGRVVLQVYNSNATLGRVSCMGWWPRGSKGLYLAINEHFAVGQLLCSSSPQLLQSELHFSIWCCRGSSQSFFLFLSLTNGEAMLPCLNIYPGCLSMRLHTEPSPSLSAFLCSFLEKTSSASDFTHTYIYTYTHKT